MAPADSAPKPFIEPATVAGEQAAVQAAHGNVSDRLVRRWYFAGLGLVYFIAFASLWSQIHGLIGERGLLPADRYFTVAREQLGTDAFWRLPSLCWWGSSDLMLHVWCAIGTSLSIVMMSGFAPRMALVGLWMIYLSLSTAGQAFLSFQWDTLLLEMTVCSLLYAPRGIRPTWNNLPEPLPLARWLLWSLAFKLMFLSGITKLLSGDPAWSDGTALMFHYYTQPLPSWTSWYAYQLPSSAHHVSIVLLLIIEAVLPFLIFAGQRGRAVFGVATILLMLVIEGTGNFGFFNLQTMVLAIPLLSDSLLRRIFQRKVPTPSGSHPGTVRLPWRIWIGSGLAVLILFVSSLVSVREMARTQSSDLAPSLARTALNWVDTSVVSWCEPRILRPMAPLRSINGYGLFRVMTTRRHEIVIEYSRDGVTWHACEFPYKPGQVDRAPPIVAPHMPRLDWQMWFAALNPRASSDWLTALTGRILEGDEATARLIRCPELARDPPMLVRLAYYEYKFSSAEQRRATGAWWSRTHVGNLTGPLSKRNEPAP